MSENFRSRLRRLRREAGTEREGQSVSESPSVSDPVGAEARVPDWLRRRIGRADAAVPSRGGTVGAPRELVELSGGGAERITRFDLGALHGSWPLADVLKADSAVLARLGKDRALAKIDPARAAFLDIETTGLSGGTGTWPYLVAIGRVVDGEFELWQGFMHAPGDEVAVMRATAERLRSAGQVVSFFGKSFDRHRLEDKMRQHGITSPFEGAPHLDLYHVCRRLYGGAYSDGRLATMERELCGVRREDDLPGSFAPAAWFDYQAGRPHLLEDVFKHNLDDVLSLVTLTAHVARSLDERDHAGRELSGDGLARARGLAKLAAERKDGPQQLRWLELGIGRVDRDAAPALHRSLELERTSALERVGEPERAILELLRLIEGGDEFAARGSVRAALLLQRAKRLEEALVVARQGRELVDRRLHGAERLRSLEQLDRRIEALEARLART